MKTALILGAGISGITAGNILKCPVLEQSDETGGLCRSFRKNGFIFDRTGHYLHVPGELEEKVFDVIDKSVLDKVKKRSGIAINNRIIDYPFQSNFHNAGDGIKEECIEGFINRPKNIEVNSFYDWILKYYGEGIAKHFMFPYNEKLWQYDLNKMTTEWLGDFIPSFSEDEIINGKSDKESYNTYFYYPREGGFDSIIFNGEAGVQLNNCIEHIDIKRKIVYTRKNNYRYDNLISTIPLNELMGMVKGFEEQLKYTSVYNINLGIKGKPPVDYHWIYFPERDISFYRVGIPSNVNKNMAPEGHYSLSIEITYREKKEIDFDTVFDKLKEYDLINNMKDIVVRKDFDIRYAYVIYNKKRERLVRQYLDFLESRNIYCTGRYGKWHYSFVAGDINNALKTAGRLQ